MRYSFWKSEPGKAREVKDRWNKDEDGNPLMKTVHNDAYRPAGTPESWKQAQEMVEKAIFSAKPGTQLKLVITIPSEDEKAKKIADLQRQIAELNKTKTA